MLHYLVMLNNHKIKCVNRKTMQKLQMRAMSPDNKAVIGLPKIIHTECLIVQCLSVLETYTHYWTHTLQMQCNHVSSSANL